jgi:hypothetical protein
VNSDTIHSTTRYRLSALTGVPKNAWIWYSYICLGSLEKNVCVCVRARAILHLGCSISFYTLIPSSEPTQPTSNLRAEPTHPPTLYSWHPFTASRARPANSHYPITLSGDSSPPHLVPFFPEHSAAYLPGRW